MTFRSGWHRDWILQ